MTGVELWNKIKAVTLLNKVKFRFFRISIILYLQVQNNQLNTLYINIFHVIILVIDILCGQWG